MRCLLTRDLASPKSGMLVRSSQLSSFLLHLTVSSADTIKDNAKTAKNLVIFLGALVVCVKHVYISYFKVLINLLQFKSSTVIKSKYILFIFLFWSFRRCSFVFISFDSPKLVNLRNDVRYEPCANNIVGEKEHNFSDNVPVWS